MSAAFLVKLWVAHYRHTVHQRPFSPKRNIFRNIFRNESVVKPVYKRISVCTLYLQVCNFTEINSIIDFFLRIFETFASNYS